MLMTTEGGNLAKVREAFRQQAQGKLGEVVGYEDTDPLSMQIEADISPAWYLAEVVGGNERATAAYLSGRRFGVCLPEIKYEPVGRYQLSTGKWLVGRGAPLPMRRIMIPGYVFVFVWMTERNWNRLKATPGVQRIACHPSGEAMSLRDEVIDQLRALETILCPLDIAPEWRRKRNKNGWRKARKGADHEEPERTYEAPRGWLHLGDGEWIDGTTALRVIDHCGADRELAKSLGLAA